MKNKVEFCELSQDDFAEIIPLAQQLNPKLSDRIERFPASDVWVSNTVLVYEKTEA